MHYTIDNTYTKEQIRKLFGWEAVKTVDNWIAANKLPQSVGPWLKPKRYPKDLVDRVINPN